jgi:xanthine dehydrogenase accessory factor
MRTRLLAALEQAIASDQPAVLATVLTGASAGEQILVIQPDETIGTLPEVRLQFAVTSEARDRLTGGDSATVVIAGERVFFEAYLPAPHLVLVGAVHIAIPLVAIAKVLGYRTTVIDARGVFATDKRFPHVDQLIEAWPDEGLAQVRLHPRVAAVVLAHDEKFEDPAMEVLLRSPVGYIGAIGSRETSRQRLARLRSYGFSETELERIHGPVGLELGGKSPEEIALSIMAEIVAVQNGRDPKSSLLPAKIA